MADTDIDVINAALTRTGDEPITSLDDGSAAAIIASQNYEIVVLAEMARSRYKLPTKFELLSLIDSDEMGDPPEPWLYGYTLPSDIVKLHTLKVGGLPIEYAQMGRLVFCNHGPVTYTETSAPVQSVEVYAHYSWRIPEAWWSPELTEGIVRRLEAIFLRGIGERHKEAVGRDGAADDQLAHARSSDSQAQSPRQPVASPALQARRGEVATSATLRARRG